MLLEANEDKADQDEEEGNTSMDLMLGTNLRLACNINIFLFDQQLIKSSTYFCA
jgi:hypothetical protein